MIPGGLFISVKSFPTFEAQATTLEAAFFPEPLHGAVLEAHSGDRENREPRRASPPGGVGTH